MGGQPGAGTPDTAIVGLGRVGQAASIFTRAGLIRGESWELVLQKVPSEFHPKVRNHGEGPY